MINKVLVVGSLLSISTFTYAQNPSSSYGIDMSFAHTGANSISTNYAWLPHNNNEIDSKSANSIPEEYKNMPIQNLGNRQEVYEHYMDGCRDYWEYRLRKRKGKGAGFRACNGFENDRFDQNRDQPGSMVNYTNVGYKKIKAPEHVFKMISDFWEVNKDNESDEEWPAGNSFVNYWDNPSKMISVEDEELIGGGEELHDAIWNVTRDIISAWTGQELEVSSVYGIRVYKEGAILAPHVDRLPLISSAIINVAQDVDEQWPLEVIGHDGKATNVTMEPGDMVLYESHSVLHGRPFALKGRFFANIFIHFMPVPSKEQINEHKLPPYIQENSFYAKEWENGRFEDEVPGAPTQRQYEDWGQHHAHDAAGEGDLDALIKIAKEEQEALHVKDDNGWQPIHEAVRSGEEDVIEFLKEQGADMNSMTKDDGDGISVLDIAIHEWGDDHDFIDWLKSLGATVTSFDLGPEL